MSRFVAIDFETANNGRESACAVGLAVCSGGRLVDSHHYLIRPRSREFLFSYIHGLSFEDVRRAPDFGGLWPELQACLRDADFLVAHNAPFDRGVLAACCRAFGLAPPALPFHCTVQLARRQWNIRPTRLPDVCRHLGIPLRHHDAGSDAQACARIVLAAEAEGWHW